MILFFLGTKKDFLKTQKFSGSFEDSLKDIRTNETIHSVRIATKHMMNVSKSSMDGISGYNSEFTNITPASSEDYIADSKQVNKYTNKTVNNGHPRDRLKCPLCTDHRYTQIIT